jgi:hypothetical protein
MKVTVDDGRCSVVIESFKPAFAERVLELLSDFFGEAYTSAARDVERTELDKKLDERAKERAG